MIVSIAEVVIKIIITVIKMTYADYPRQSAWRRKHPWLEQESGRVKTHKNICYWALQALALYGKNLHYMKMQLPRQKKKNGIYNTFHVTLPKNG